MKRIASLAALAVIISAVTLAFGPCGSSKSGSEQTNDLLNTGLQQHVNGQLDQAAATYREVLKKDPQNKFAYYNLGLIDQTNGNAASAENNYRLALGIDPAYPPALFNLAIVRAGLGDAPGAIALYRKVLDAQPDNAGAHLNLGLLLVAGGSVEEGSAYLAKAAQLDPKLAARAAAAISPTPTYTPADASGEPPVEATATP